MFLKDHSVYIAPSTSLNVDKIYNIGGLMVSTLDSGSGGPGSSPGLGTAFCSWAEHFTLIVPLSTQVYKWIPADLLLGLTLRWTSIPSMEE